MSMGHLSQSPEQLGHLPEGGLRNNGMSHEGYADPVMNDGPRFHSIIPVSELTERVTQARAIEASDISSAPLAARNHGQGNAQNSTDPYQAQ